MQILSLFIIISFLGRYNFVNESEIIPIIDHFFQPKLYLGFGIPFRYHMLVHFIFFSFLTEKPESICLGIGIVCSRLKPFKFSQLFLIIILVDGSHPVTVSRLRPNISSSSVPVRLIIISHC